MFISLIKWTVFTLIITHQVKVVALEDIASEDGAKSKVSGRRWTQFKPFVPSSRDYSLETGIMWEENNLYWLGGQVGWHLGRCVLSKSQTCQQYFDVLAGVGGRDGLTNGMLAGSFRWQFIKIPNY